MRLSRYSVTKWAEPALMPLNAPRTRAYPGRWWHMLDDGRMQCDLCPRDCRLHEGQRGACFVRQRVERPHGAHDLRALVGFCIDPIEKKPLNHFYPGHERAVVRHRGLQPRLQVLPELGHLQVARHGPADGSGERRSASPPPRYAPAARSVAFTYNDPVIFAEYAMDVADACHARGIKTVAVTAGYMHDAAAARVLREDGRGERRSQGVHRRVLLQALTGVAAAAGARHARYLRHETDVWFEITTLLIPAKNDSDEEIDQLSNGSAKELGTDVPLHFTAFHPDYKMTDTRPRRRPR